MRNNQSLTHANAERNSGRKSDISIRYTQYPIGYTTNGAEYEGNGTWRDTETGKRIMCDPQERTLRTPKTPKRNDFEERTPLREKMIYCPLVISFLAYDAGKALLLPPIKGLGELIFKGLNAIAGFEKDEPQKNTSKKSK